MKKIISVTILSFILLFVGAATADTRIAVVDVVSILQQMPQREGIIKAIEAEFSPRAKALQDEEKKAKDAAQKLQKEGMTLSSKEKTKLTDLISAFQEKANTFTADYRKRENEEANKLLAKIGEVVKKIATQEKYELVLKAEAAFYATDAVDITDKVFTQVKK